MSTRDGYHGWAGDPRLGWISRRRVPELLRAATFLCSLAFRATSTITGSRRSCPSSSPRATGRPPRTNIGLHLEDGVEAMLLERGDADEMEEKVAILAEDPALRRRLGDGGRAFARRALQWSTNVREVVRLYDEIG